MAMGSQLIYSSQKCKALSEQGVILPSSPGRSALSTEVASHSSLPLFMEGATVYSQQVHIFFQSRCNVYVPWGSVLPNPT